jgi:hypothetical protein
VKGRLTLGAMLGMALALGAAQPAGAVQIGIGDATTGPIPVTSERAVVVQAAPGENNDITVRATDPVTALDPSDEALGYPLTVTVTDAGATFDTTPATGYSPCQIVDAHTARCSAPADTYFQQARVHLDDGTNRLQFAPGSVPVREMFTAGDGNDTVSTGAFVGDVSYRWASDTGGGNDTVHIGPAPRGWLGGALGLSLQGLALYTRAGDDTIVAANGMGDEVSCGDGKDTLVADAIDSDTVYVEDPGSCETRVLPPVP